MDVVSTEQKLALIKAIREKHAENDNCMRLRENILYKGIPDYQRDTFQEEINIPGKVNRFSTVKIRLLFSVILFLLFFFLDINNSSIAGLTTPYILEKISNKCDLLTINTIDFTALIPYTLKDN